ncbi:MAG: zinc ribbon domain-containing protein [Acidobacteria bacterium]|nr:zinc ribbon domain-containing protein [Acidobacteriota bacterium]
MTNFEWQGQSMFCGRCGTEIRPHARFCRSCGAQVQERQRPRQPNLNPRLPPGQNLPPLAHPPREPVRELKQDEEFLILPITEKISEIRDDYSVRESEHAKREPKPEIVSFDPRSIIDMTPLLRKPGRKNNNARRNKVVLSESDAKPFFTRALKGEPNRHHQRLIGIVPVLMLVVIILFVFAYMAAR